MAFCINCGQEFAEGANFCANCGKAVNENNATNQRITVYGGEIHKCPQCGEVLDSFITVCPACGYELRGSSATDAIKEFATKLNNVITEDQKEIIIRSFPIPNTKEDIFEFMILAASNLKGEHNERVFNAWIAKFEQCYKKATLSFADDANFRKIQNLYIGTTQQISKEKADIAISKFMSPFTNPVFSIVVALLGIYEIIRIIKGQFAGVDIVIVAIILWIVYKATDKKDKKKK